MALSGKIECMRGVPNWVHDAVKELEAERDQLRAELAAAKRHNKDLIDHITGVRPWLGRSVEKLLKGDYAMEGEG